MRQSLTYNMQNKIQNVVLLLKDAIEVSIKVSSDKTNARGLRVLEI